jgi:hypothetical protein
MKSLLFCLAIVAAPLQGAAPRKPDDPHPAVPQGRVDEAIRRGVEFLKTAPSPPGKKGEKLIQDSDELVLLTFLHAGVPESDPKFQTLLGNILKKELTRTYQVSVLAMVLEELDRARYQQKIAQCAQYLVDGMMDHGRWSYGTPSEFASSMTVEIAPKGTATGPKPAPRSKAPAVRKITVEKMKKPGALEADNSNSQYAALGLRACHEAGIVLPKSVIETARKAWIDTQHPVENPDGIARKIALPGKTGKTVATLLAEPRGWCYGKGAAKCESSEPAYASMTAGAVGALCIYDYILGTDWKTDPPVLSGLAWLDKTWSVAENLPALCGAPDAGPLAWRFYYLYALERAGMLYYTTHVGPHDWYQEGAMLLLDSQSKTGSWAGSETKWDNATWDTCFAILFLKRATRPMVPSTDRFIKK